MLEINDLHKSYDGVLALRGCTFSVPRGSMVGFLGPNGAGKTTAMRSVFGLVRPERGEIRWRGHSITAQDRLRFGYMPEQRGLYPKMRVSDQLVYFGRLHGLSRRDAQRRTATLLGQLGLSDRARDRVEELSHGNQQRVQLAVALLHDPELLMLDEPFSGLDPIGVASLSALLQERSAAGAAVVFSSHQLDLVEGLCEEVVVIDRGGIVLHGLVDDLRAASSRRYLEVGVVGCAAGWDAGLPGDVVAASDRRVRLLVPADLDLSAVYNDISRRGTVTDFTFEPPTLSEVFREAVGQ